ncbi:MAG: YHS domain-containing protein [Sedimentisphaerales bacterium]|jgi:YHS domain-containing protein
MRTILSAVFMITVLFFVNGCKKQSSPPPTSSPAANSVTQTQPAASAEQTICPVMTGNPIDKNVFVEYKGKKVYFCCTQCKAEFEKNPEKYLSKLPQFAK